MRRHRGRGERAKREAEIRAEVADFKEKAIAAGGLYIIGTERHESRRIDNQLRGRSGRQGDPGRSKFFLSLQDDLMRIFGSERMDTMLRKLGLKEDEAIVHPWINKALEKAQQKVEARNFDMRKNILKYDNVMNDQRKVVFEQRREMMAQESLEETGRRHAPRRRRRPRVEAHPADAYPETWDVAGLQEAVQNALNLDLPVEDWAKEEGIADEEMRERLQKAADDAYAERVEKNTPEVMRYVEKQIVLQAARPSLARASRHARSPAPGDRLARLCAARSAERVQVRGLRAVQRADHPLARDHHGAADARRGRVRAAAAARCRPCTLRISTPTSGEDEMAIAEINSRIAAGDFAPQQLVRRGARRSRDDGARPGRSLDLGQGRPQRGLPLRLRQEVQALPRGAGLAGATANLTMSCLAGRASRSLAISPRASSTGLTQ